MFKKELIILRHPRSKYNMRETKELDSDITDFGFQQAKNVARFLNDEVLKGELRNIISSPYLRCLRLADEIAKARPHFEHIFHVKSEFREYLNHSGSECFVKNRKESFGIHWPSEFGDGQTFYNEYNEQFMDRICEGYDSLPDKSIVVTHGLPAMALLQVATSTDHTVPIWNHSIDNCSITIVRKGRIVWLGRNLYNELPYDSNHYQ